jgi:hypothetical protein
MRKKQIILLSMAITLGFIAFAPIINARAAKYTCPDTTAGDTKILKVTTVDATGLEAMLGSDWQNNLSNVFGGEAYKIGARSKSVVLSINKTAQYNTTLFYGSPFNIYVGIGVVETCNITTDNWEFTTTEFASTPDTSSTDVNVIKDPEKFNEACSAYYFGQNVTVSRMAIHLAQLPQNPAGYLAEINWSIALGFGSQGSTIVHDIQNAPWSNLNGITYYQNGTETWTYAASSGAWIGYELKDENGNTIYEFEIDLPGIPGFEIPIFLGITAVSIIGIIAIMKRKKRL